MSLALTSALLTIYLTNSTTFVTRKESGVLAPDFPGSVDGSKGPTPVPVSKRKVMYYVRCSWRSLHQVLAEFYYTRRLVAGFLKLKQFYLVSGCVRFFLALQILSFRSRVCYPRLPRWSDIVHEVGWPGIIRCIWPFPWQRRSICTYC